MRITKIQSTVARPQNQQNLKNITRITNQPEQTDTVTVSSTQFKGNGGGALTGLGTGLIGGLLVFAGGAITGLLVVPVAIGSLGIIAAGAAGAYVGDKIEDAITGTGKKKD